jgi:hypothetical protein
MRAYFSVREDLSLQGKWFLDGIFDGSGRGAQLPELYARKAAGDHPKNQSIVIRCSRSCPGNLPAKSFVIQKENG